MSTVSVSEATFTAEDFRTNAGLYNESAKLRRAFDAVLALGVNAVDDTVAHIRKVIAALEVQSENGAGYTPDKAMGFGSENGASIADGLLGRRPTSADLRKNFAKVGSN